MFIRRLQTAMQAHQMNMNLQVVLKIIKCVWVENRTVFDIPVKCHDASLLLWCITVSTCVSTSSNTVQKSWFLRPVDTILLGFD